MSLYNLQGWKLIYLPSKSTFIIKTTIKKVTPFSSYKWKWSAVSAVKIIIVYYDNKWSLRKENIISENKNKKLVLQ